jgi:hypothetical protein
MLSAPTDAPQRFGNFVGAAISRPHAPGAPLRPSPGYGKRHMPPVFRRGRRPCRNVTFTETPVVPKRLGRMLSAPTDAPQRFGNFVGAAISRPHAPGARLRPSPGYGERHMPPAFRGDRRPRRPGAPGARLRSPKRRLCRNVSGGCYPPLQMHHNVSVISWGPPPWAARRPRRHVAFAENAGCAVTSRPVPPCRCSLRARAKQKKCSPRGNAQSVFPLGEVFFILRRSGAAAGR